MNVNYQTNFHDITAKNIAFLPNDNYQFDINTLIYKVQQNIM